MLLISLVIPLRENNGDVELWGQIRKTKDELYNHWEFPGGKIEKEEAPIDAAIREIEEEVGVALSRDDVSLGFIFTNPKIQFHVFFTKHSFPENKGRYLLLKEVHLTSEVSIPEVNKEFLRKYEAAFKAYLTL